MTFTAVNQMLVALLGGTGRFVALVLLALQLAAAGGTYPIETSPGFFGFLHDLLPMSHVVDGLRAATAGGSRGRRGRCSSHWSSSRCLALALTVVAATTSADRHAGTAAPVDGLIDGMPRPTDRVSVCP